MCRLTADWRAYALVLAISGLTVGYLFSSSEGHGSESRSEHTLALFKEMARKTRPCTDVTNRLLQIDAQVVLWDTQGRCFAIAGPVMSCKDVRYQEMFQTIIRNLDKPDLGLGTGHPVEPIPF